MKYLCLVYLEEKRPAEVPDSKCLAYDAAIRKSGHCIASEALQSVETASTVRVRNGKVSVTDGPFAETKEQLAGFYLIEAKAGPARSETSGSCSKPEDENAVENKNAVIWGGWTHRGGGCACLRPLNLPLSPEVGGVGRGEGEVLRNDLSVQLWTP